MKNVNKEKNTLTDAKPLLSPVVTSEILKYWDTAVVDLNRNVGLFTVDNVRLRNCSLHFNDFIKEYYIRFGSVTYGIHDIYNRR